MSQVKDAVAVLIKKTPRAEAIDTLKKVAEFKKTHKQAVKDWKDGKCTDLTAEQIHHSIITFY